MSPSRSKVSVYLQIPVKMHLSVRKRRIEICFSAMLKCYLNDDIELSWTHTYNFKKIEVIEWIATIRLQKNIEIIRM